MVAFCIKEESLSRVSVKSEVPFGAKVIPPVSSNIANAIPLS
jgi:predicted fused transcriptional regulator/phosphomethylpyrimidine kinase